MYIILTHESSNGKSVEFGLGVEPYDYSFEVLHVCISGGYTFTWNDVSIDTFVRWHRYILKNIKDIYKQFDKRLEELEDQSLSDF